MSFALFVRYPLVIQRIPDRIDREGAVWVRARLRVVVVDVVAEEMSFAGIGGCQ